MYPMTPVHRMGKKLTFVKFTKLFVIKFGITKDFVLYLHL